MGLKRSLGLISKHSLMKNLVNLVLQPLVRKSYSGNQLEKYNQLDANQHNQDVLCQIPCVLNLLAKKLLPLVQKIVLQRVILQVNEKGSLVCVNTRTRSARSPSHPTVLSTN